MNSRAAGRWIAAPLMFVGVRLATKYVRHAPPGVVAAVEWLGDIVLAIIGAMMVGGLIVIFFPRLGARLFPWSAAARPRRES